METKITPNAPISAKYIVQTADGILTSEQALGALATGILYNTTTTGVLSIAAAGTDYAAPNQTMYIGTTAVAINRASAALTLAGITLTTPDCGTPSAIVLTNASGTVTNLTLVTPALGTPSSGTLTSCTGLPISTGISGLGANVATFLATPSSANLLATVTDETGSGLLVFGSVWTAYTPTLTNITLGNGTLTASYMQVGKTVHFKISLTLGSTSAMGTAPTFTLPVTAVAASGLIYGLCLLADYGTADYVGFSLQDSTTTVKVYVTNVAGTYPTLTTITATVPYTWAVSDVMVISGTYEAA